MARILLISCNTTTEPYPVYPLGMAMIADALISTGHEVCEYDVLASPSLGDKLESACTIFGPEVIGLSIRNNDNLNHINAESYSDDFKELAKQLRKISNAPIVLGGSGYSLYPEALLSKIGADYGIVGEGEFLFPQLIAQLMNCSIPKNKIFYASQNKSVAAFGSSYRNPALSKYYLKHGGMLNLHTKRGCPMNCGYCAYPIIEGKNYRFRTPANVVDEIEQMRDQYEMDYFSIADSVFNDPQGHYLEIAEELVKRDIKIPFTAFLKPSGFQRENVQLLKEAGLKSVEWGTDASSDTTLKALGKDFTWETVIHSNRLFAEEGIAGAHFIIFGGPGETAETIEEGLKNFHELKNALIMACIGIRIIPGTKVQQLAIEQNLINGNDNLLEPKYYLAPGLETKVVDQRLRDAFNGHREWIYPLGDQDLEMVTMFHQMGHRGPIWDYLLKADRKRKRAISKNL
ncbi:MAG: cobalamin-dependent protein [Desulfobacterales bacterium]|nr:cobalamin-dependent protein [Desulfobacterales bacterium]